MVVARQAGPPGGRAARRAGRPVRVRVDTGQSETDPAAHRPTPAIGRDRSVEGVSIAFDRDGREPVLLDRRRGPAAPDHLVSTPATTRSTRSSRSSTTRAPMGSLSLSPDGRTLAARVGLDRPALGPGPLRPGERRPPVAADRPRRRVAGRVDRHARRLGPVDPRRPPVASTDPKARRGDPVDRPTFLPILGEFEPNSEPAYRLRRIGQARPAPLRPAGRRPARRARRWPPSSTRPGSSSTTSARITRPPSPRSKRWKPGPTTPDRRLGLLTIRAQIFLDQGKVDRAGTDDRLPQGVASRGPARRVEWTGDGYRLAEPTRPRAGAGPTTWPGGPRRSGRCSATTRPDNHVNPDAPRANFGLDAALAAARIRSSPDRPFLTDPDRRPGPRPPRRSGPATGPPRHRPQASDPRPAGSEDGEQDDLGRPGDPGPLGRASSTPRAAISSIGRIVWLIRAT